MGARIFILISLSLSLSINALAIGFGTPSTFTEYCQSMEEESVSEGYKPFADMDMEVNDYDYSELYLSGPDDGDPIGGVPLDGGELVLMLPLVAILYKRIRRQTF